MPSVLHHDVTWHALPRQPPVGVVLGGALRAGRLRCEVPKLQGAGLAQGGHVHAPLCVPFRTQSQFAYIQPASTALELASMHATARMQELDEEWRRRVLAYQQQIHAVAVKLLKAIFVGLGRDASTIE